VEYILKKQDEKVIIEYAQLHNKHKVSLVLPLLGCGVGSLSKMDVIKKYHNFFTADRNDKEIDCLITIYGYSQEDMNLLSVVSFL